MWSGVIWNHEKIWVAQTWGCPAYVLDIKLQKNLKYPSGHQGITEEIN